MARRDYTYGSAGDCTITFSLASPEGVVVAPTGSMHLDLATTTIYLKQDGEEDTGWVVSAGGAGGLPDGDYGDISISGDGSLITVNDAAITFDKIQDISSQVVLGRISPGDGDVEEIPFETLGAMLGVNVETGNNLLSGGGVSWVEDLDFHVAAATYLIQSIVYSSPATVVTLAAADPTDPRIDVIAVDTTGSVIVLPGTPSVTPEPADVDPETQLLLTFIYVPAGAVEPNIVVTVIYRENVEWTTSKSGTPINLASTVNPYAGTLDIEGTAAATNNWMQFASPAPFDPNTFDELVLHIRSKALWATTRQLNINLRQGTTTKGSTIVLKDGRYGFSSSNTSDYQTVVIPMTDFGAGGLSITSIRITVAGTGATIGFYIDNIELQTGIQPPVQTGETGRMRWRGNYYSVLAYSANDVVLNDDGIQYVALQDGSGNDPATATAYWQPSSSAGAANIMRGATFVSGVPLTVLVPPTSVYFPRAATINRVVVLGDTDGSVEVDIKKSTLAAAAGGAGGISICGGDFPEIVADDYLNKTSFPGWTLGVAAGDCLNFSLVSVATFTRVSVQVFLEESV